MLNPHSNHKEALANIQVRRTQKHGIPLDVQYGDIDYMERQLDFTWNNKTYNELPQFVRDIKKDGIKYITILGMKIET